MMSKISRIDGVLIFPRNFTKDLLCILLERIKSCVLRIQLHDILENLAKINLNYENIDKDSFLIWCWDKMS